MPYSSSDTVAFCFFAVPESTQLVSFCFEQEEKIAALQSFADQLISADHYAKGVVSNRRNEVLDRLVY